MPSPFSDPVELMLTKIKELQHTAPFVPFRIVTSDGRSHYVPTPDHITVMGLRRDIVVERDDYSSVTISPLHVTSVERQSFTPV